MGAAAAGISSTAAAADEGATTCLQLCKPACFSLNTSSSATKQLQIKQHWASTTSICRPTTAVDSSLPAAATTTAAAVAHATAATTAATATTTAEGTAAAVCPAATETGTSATASNVSTAAAAAATAAETQH